MVKLDGSDRYRPALIFECNKIALRHDASSIGNRGEATSRPAMAQKYSALLELEHCWRGLGKFLLSCGTRHSQGL